MRAALALIVLGVAAPAVGPPPALADIRRQARAVLHWFEEV